MKTPYVPHRFGADVTARLQATSGWLTASIASSIPWPQDDVLLTYDGADYLLRGAMLNGKPATSCISTPCPHDDFDEALARVLKFVSVLSWFKRGYVDVVGYTWSTSGVRYGHAFHSHATTLQGDRHGLAFNHLPIIEDDQVRKALAFIREGRRLRHVQDAYAFLSFFKVLESQFSAAHRKDWIARNVGTLTGDAGKRVAALQAQGIDVGDHLYKSGRCAVAHASVGDVIVDPDVPEDRKRISEDIVVMEALAERYVRVEARVPDERDLYEVRDRLAPWHPLLAPEGLARLQEGGAVDRIELVGQLHGATVSVRLLPDPPMPALEALTLRAVGSLAGGVHLQAHNRRRTIFLNFMMDVARGRMYVLVDRSGATQQFGALEEQEVEAAARFVHSVIGNAVVELTIEGLEPVDCEVVIPVNIIPRDPEEVVAETVEAFRRSRALSDPAPGGPAL